MKLIVPQVRDFEKSVVILVTPAGLVLVCHPRPARPQRIEQSDLLQRQLRLAIAVFAVAVFPVLSLGND
jgi:hypothetical protein